MKNKDPLIYFKFKPLKAAKVSEISESTAASSTPLDEQVHFHIGNPIQDNRLVNLYFKNVTGIFLENEEISDPGFNSKIEDSDWEISQKEQIELIYNCIKNGAPYMPRGGFNRSAPPELIRLFQNWLNVEQPEPLEYNFGEHPGNRECIIASGGIWESLRIFYFSLNKHLEFTPAHILLFHSVIPDYASECSTLVFKELPDDDQAALKSIANVLKQNETSPIFLVLGKITAESTRRTLRKLSLRYPLFFIEINDAPNHFSMAREAKMLNRVLRFITPAVFSDVYANQSIVFVLGNGDFLKVIETVHFELKGTPSATEVELLTYCLKLKAEYQNETSQQFENGVSNNHNHHYGLDNIATKFTKHTNTILDKAADLTESVQLGIEKRLDTVYKKSMAINILPNTRLISKYDSNKLMHLSSPQILDRFLQDQNQSEWIKDLSESFLSSFLNHHPEYEIQYSSIVSGSARTAMSLLGYHCGINDVIITDLSWTYEHCFPKVTTVPLNSNFSLDAAGIIDTVQKKIRNDPSWKKRGAVILNNPHNASGSIIDENKLIELIKWLLENDIFIIDDLSYQNVLPKADINGPRTIKQIVSELGSNGAIRSSQIKYLITIHSLSKTDCFAGARLAVSEILHPQLFMKFQECNAKIKPNVMAILTAYLFYRNYPEVTNAFWKKRNEIFSERMSALSDACQNLPSERNPFGIEIVPPQGSMYPRLVINRLPSGISLDWLSSGLALNGIGLIPFSTFARTAEGYELARKTFRLTLGGKDSAAELLRKTRRVLIDLNRLIANETSKYNKKNITVRHHVKIKNFDFAQSIWNDFSNKLHEICKNNIKSHIKHFSKDLDSEELVSRFFEDFFPKRLSTFNQKINDATMLSERIVLSAKGKESNKLISILEKEFYKENLTDRAKDFRNRLYDRTVHPTQMYSLDVEMKINSFIEIFLNERMIDQKNIENFAHSLFDEFLGKNVAISSIEESDESICDLKSMIWTDEFSRWNCGEQLDLLLSFWGDWDGSTRPSGQGHRLAASVVMENVRQLSEILQTLLIINDNSKINTSLYKEINQLPANNIRFWNLLNKITSLTNYLEKRFQSILPANISVSKIKSFGMRLRVVPDPYESLWQHNDKLERRMQKLRDERRQMLEYYFSLNKQLRKTLSANIRQIKDSLNNTKFALQAGSYRSLLRRFVLTPRIHQKLITAKDQFSIDTTVHNLVEINDVAGRYGNPGMVLALQVSMSKEPEAFIALDRKIKSKIEEVTRENPEYTLPFIWIIPLFEDVKSVQSIPSYLDRLWDYAIQSRHIDQKPDERFTEMLCELFIAGSDLSQQASQTAGACYYKEAKYSAIRWLADRGLVGKIRIKLGSGEPMQRQGGYYFPKSGEPAFLKSKIADQKLKNHLKPSTKESVKYAISPLQGVMSSGDLRTFQSNIAEQLRSLPVEERTQLIYHIKESQRYHESELYRAAEPLVDTRLQFREKGLNELEMLTKGKEDNEYKNFVGLVTKNFRQILYGLEEDVIGIHVVSYFISRTVPSLRDRPTVRPSQEIGEGQGKKIIDRISRTIPLSRHGTLLRAIGHNQAQTAVLGINQLTTGLFRALREFIEKQTSFEEGVVKLGDRILPFLPVQEILHTLRIYHDPALTYINRLKEAFPPGNSAFLILREDNDCLKELIYLVQKEMLRRQGVNIIEFFDEKYFNPELLPTLRPDIAALLQQNLFNTDFAKLADSTDGSMDDDWQREVQYLLRIPEQVQDWRTRIWQLIEDPIKKQVESFNELALAINALSIGEEQALAPLMKESASVSKISSQVSDLLRGTGDDSMRQFLFAVVQYIDRASQNMIDMPIEIIRVLRDIEKIVRIEQQALSKSKQDLLRFYILQIARLCGENG